MKKISPRKDKGVLGFQGFSMIELMIVVAILGILGVVVGVYINTADAKLRSFAFNVGSRFKQAKFEAIKNGFNVYLDFDLNNDNAIDGNSFTIWSDNNKDGNYDPPGEKVGADVVFPEGTEIYDPADASGGPPDIDGAPASSVLTDIFNGVADSGDLRIRFTPGGAAENATVYIYSPRLTGGGKKVAAGPWAIIVNSVGRIQLAEWKDGAWVE